MKRKYSTGKEFHRLIVQGKNYGERKIMQPIRIASEAPNKK